MIYENYDELCRSVGMPVNTDMLAFTNIYKRLGIELRIGAFEIVKGGKEYVYQIKMMEGGYPDGYETESDKFEGYFGFYTEVYFDNDGKFIKQGFWE